MMFSKVFQEISMPEMRDSFSPKAFGEQRIDACENRSLTTINEHMEGKKHPETDVEYKRKVIIYDGKRIDGVFPQFDSKFDVQLPKDLYEASDYQQAKYCVDQLAKAIEKDPELAKQFTPRQLEAIKNREVKIPGLTWHHSEEPGKMQLVDSEKHGKTAHTGGRVIWGGGQENRFR